MNSATIERWYPYVVAILMAMLYWLLLGDAKVPATAINVLGAVVSLAGITVGFLAAIQSIFVAIDDRPIIKDLKQVGTYEVIVRYLHSAIIWSAILALGSVVGLLKDFKTSHWPTWVVSIWIFCAVASVLCAYRAFRVFQKILKSKRR